MYKHSAEMTVVETTAVLSTTTSGGGPVTEEMAGTTGSGGGGGVGLSDVDMSNVKNIIGETWSWFRTQISYPMTIPSSEKPVTDKPHD